MLFGNFIELFLESAPWLLLGLALAGLLKVFVPMSWMHQQLGGKGVKSIVKAALIGAPLPLCSCGVIPAALGLRRAGASKAATTSFMIATPETGVDSISVSYALLGPFMAVVRPIAAIASAITAGFLVSRYDHEQQSGCSCKKEENSQSSCCSSKEETNISGSCCSSKEETNISSSCCSSKKKTDSKNSCCTSKKEIGSEKADIDNESSLLSKRIVKGLHFAATELVAGISVWLIIGLFFAALVQTYVPADFLAKWGDGIPAMLVMILISIPMYICATASTVIAAGLLLAGISPGAILVFMLAGPATNIATLGVIIQELGKKVLWGYLGGVLGIAVLAGVIVNYLIATFGFVVMPQMMEQHALLPDMLIYSSGVLLALLMAKAFYDMLAVKIQR